MLSLVCCAVRHFHYIVPYILFFSPDDVIVFLRLFERTTHFDVLGD